MKYLFALMIYLLCLKHQQSAPTLTDLEDKSLSKKIKALSKVGEEYVVQEIRKALVGVKQMKKIMERNEEKHENILKSLKKTKDENQEAVRLFEDINVKLNEAEIQCKQFLNTEWEGCKSCLEWSCIKFYANSCSQQELQTFVAKAQQLLKESPPLSLISGNIEEEYKSEHYMAVQPSKKKSVFSQLMTDISTLFNKSIAFFRNHNGFNESFQNNFFSDFNQLNVNNSTMMPNRDQVIISNYFEHWDFPSLLQSLYEFGQSVFEIMADVFVIMYKKFNGDLSDDDLNDTYMPLQDSPVHSRSMPSKILCNELQNASECLLFQKRCQLCYESVMKDCPDVIELHLKSEAAFKLVNVSRQQYEDVTQIVQQHTEESFNLVSQMKDQFGWVTEHTNITSDTDSIFNIEKVSFSPNTDTVVEARIFSANNFIILVPANIEVDSPQFIQYIVDKSLEYHKNNF
ncbi:clusterin-like protein 1 isoform X1 [Phyllobates terribilis]|uniref:clusterin-like protein 1 isoform X1 n=1 Tax=Phyllobates terribilis TaxID=111132 RepID=UPI003CCAACEC